jgi:hypothetical protein
MDSLTDKIVPTSHLSLHAGKKLISADDELFFFILQDNGRLAGGERRAPLQLIRFALEHYPLTESKLV